MSEPNIYVHGVGAVSPAGWGAGKLLQAIVAGVPLPKQKLDRPGWNGRVLEIRQVPVPNPRPAFLANPRLRRTSPLSHYIVASALEAIGADAARITGGEIRLGIVVALMTGCVNYSRRFYDETLKDPATASPLVFPETVFNAPGSHLGALLGATGINYTIVGDSGVFLQGAAIAVDWLLSGMVDAAVVIGAEEKDWLTADASRLFAKGMVLSDGAGALYLRNIPSQVRLDAITEAHLFTRTQTRAAAARQVRDELPVSDGTLLLDGLQGTPRMDRDEMAAWGECPGERLSIKQIVGEGLTAAAAWQCVTAVDAVQRGRSAANVAVIGPNQQAIGARFVRAS